ncbi:hypothetical protein DYB28_000376 [Aphanomyces astaci]|uniref:Uncharacterized protein n=1 Tax=Aphanomyces astaci TaxID=112090 RepID=A0A9X8E2W2_APHAT|nr:hypothetical protein DYB28_000376 [Aphanomyces astaci]
MKSTTEIKGKQIRTTLTSAPSRAMRLSTNPRRSARNQNKRPKRNKMVNLPPPALSFTQIKKQARDLVEKHGVDPKKMFIRGLTKMGFFTIKSMGKDLDSVYDTMEEYLSNRVHDTAKLRDFYSVEIMIFK